MSLLLWPGCTLSLDYNYDFLDFLGNLDTSTIRHREPMVMNDLYDGFKETVKFTVAPTTTFCIQVHTEAL